MGRAARAAARGERHHARVRLEQRRRRADRQRPVARLSDPRAARPSRADRRGRHGAVALDRRLHGELADRGADRRPQRDPRGRHERRAAAGRARVPGADGRPRPVRLRVGDQVGHRARGDPLRQGDRLLDDPRLVGARADQAAVAHRRAREAAGPEGGRDGHRRRRLAADGRHLGRGGADRRGRVAAGDARDRDLGRHVGAVEHAVDGDRRRPPDPLPRDQRQPASFRPRSVSRTDPDGATGWHERFITVFA